MKNRICLLIAMLGLTFSIQCGSDARSEETGPNNSSSCECVKKAVFEVTFELIPIVLEGPWKMSDGPVVQIRVFEGNGEGKPFMDGKWSVIDDVNLRGDIAITDGAVHIASMADHDVGIPVQVIVLY